MIRFGLTISLKTTLCDLNSLCDTCQLTQSNALCLDDENVSILFKILSQDISFTPATLEQAKLTAVNILLLCAERQPATKVKIFKNRRETFILDLITRANIAINNNLIRLVGHSSAVFVPEYSRKICRALEWYYHEQYPIEIILDCYSSAVDAGIDKLFPIRSSGMFFYYYLPRFSQDELQPREETVCELLKTLPVIIFGHNKPPQCREVYKLLVRLAKQYYNARRADRVIVILELFCTKLWNPPDNKGMVGVDFSFLETFYMETDNERLEKACVRCVSYISRIPTCTGLLDTWKRDSVIDKLWATQGRDGMALLEILYRSATPEMLLYFKSKYYSQVLISLEKPYFFQIPVTNLLTFILANTIVQDPRVLDVIEAKSDSALSALYFVFLEHYFNHVTSPRTENKIKPKVLIDCIKIIQGKIRGKLRSPIHYVSSEFE